MASGPSGRSNPGSKPFDFGDDILCSNDYYGAQDGDNGSHSDPPVAANPAKEFHKSRMARSSVYPSATYSPPEESSFNQDVMPNVENTVKKYTENIMRFLEGISSRLSQVEVYCYNLDKSIGEMRSDLVRDHEESESKLKTLEKHVQEVHRAVQILRDKQELADTQKELAKLQLAQKEVPSASNTQQIDDRASTPATEAKKSDSSSDAHDKQLALVLPHQVAPPPSLPTRPVEHQQPPMAPPASLPPQSMAPVHAYYLPAPQTTNIPPPSQPSQTQYLPTQSQVQDHTRMAPVPQSQVNPNPHVQSGPPYQQQWPQQPQQPVMQPQIRNSSQMVYSNYIPGQSNQPPVEMAPNSMPMQMPHVGASQPGSAGPEAIPYGYGAPSRPIQPQPAAQHHKTGYGAPPGEGYVPSGPRPALPPGNTYMMFDGEGGRAQQPPPQQHFQQTPYPPTSYPLQNPQRLPSANMVLPHSMRSHPYNELIEKLVTMGYRGDHVVGIIQRLEESGQPIDFNSVLDRLNGHSSGGSQRGWSG
ncbi:Non-specific serine/threonine protein kinase [Handroanthus impetiginosus]|uniref:Non-specific serine/threonine protein kinase n=1 Tax=Handroanthus impetiginosus TaxID=429701 RepID=A0A2G9HP18_9LAMI|nr:Non-specific serine/threonine protein kinase [Handroanthus impetiginosus]